MNSKIITSCHAFKGPILIDLIYISFKVAYTDFTITIFSLGH